MLTRSDRVRVVWTEFSQVWVAFKHEEIAKELEQLLHAVETNPRVRGKALEDSKDKIINSKRRDFAMAARAEWERRLEREGLQAEDWSDIRPDEMAAVEQVLSCDEGDPQPTVPMMAPPHEEVVPTQSSRVAAEASHPMASHPAAGRSAQPSPPAAPSKIPQAPQPTAAQKGKQTHGQPAWAAWGPGPRHVSVTEVPEEPPQVRILHEQTTISLFNLVSIVEDCVALGDEAERADHRRRPRFAQGSPCATTATDISARISSSAACTPGHDVSRPRSWAPRLPCSYLAEDGATRRRDCF